MNTKNRQVLRTTLFSGLALVFFGGSSPRLFAGAFETLLAATQDGAELRFSNADLLKQSQISYRAEGGFSGVQSYGVILSCVNGRVSVLKTISDPRLQDQAAVAHDVSSISSDDYLALWDNLDRQAIFRMSDVPDPKRDINDEFTVTFHANVGNFNNDFHAVGITRPVAARCFAIRALIDDAVHMKALWVVHSDVARLNPDSVK